MKDLRTKRKLIKHALALSAALLIVFVWRGPQTSTQSSPFKASPLPRGPKDTFPLSVNCENARNATLAFKSKAVASERIAAHFQLDKHPERLAQMHTKYIRGFFNFQEGKNFRVVPLEMKSIIVLSVAKASYPATITIDQRQDDLSLYPPGLMGDTIRETSPAIEVEYLAQQSVKICGQAAEHLVMIPMVLPRDPYLAYWAIPSGKRTVINWGSFKDKTNPCADDQIADLKMPSQFWYVWKPEAKRNGINCRKELQGKFTISTEATVTYSKLKSMPADFSMLKNVSPIRISLITGFLGKNIYKDSLPGARRLHRFIQTDREISAPDLNDLDPGTVAAYQVILALKEIADLREWETKGTENSFLFKNVGKLKLSGKPIELSIYHGPTVEYQEGGKHWEFFRGALETSDFIFYTGHAGMGTAFGLKRMQEELKAPFNGARPRYQFIAVLSCYSAAYYGEDLVQNRFLGSMTDLLVTGFAGFTHLLIPAVLQYVDHDLAGEEVSLKKVLERFLPVDGDVHISRYHQGHS